MLNSASTQYPYSREDLQTLREYDGDGNLLYEGLARPGASTSAAEWQIRKFTYNAANKVTSIKFAGSTNEYSKVWDDRAGYTYG